MIVTYDTEFLDDGETIELLSIGLVAADGREFYAPVKDADWFRASGNEWLMDNVIRPHIPVGPRRDNISWIDIHDPSFRTRAEIAEAVEAFLRETPDVELWADHPATDHVAGYQLFGSMIEASRDHGWPMRTSCLTQEEIAIRRYLVDNEAVGAHRPALSPRPVQDPKTLHHALHDARHDMELARWLGLVA